MKKFFAPASAFALGLAVLLAGFSSQAQAPKARENAWFPGQGMMPLGAYYYPEHWPRSRWEQDIKRMSQLGFKFIHMSEFAWSQLEPEDNRFTFGWLDTCVALSAKYNLQVILCTPTPTPPAWLTTKFDDITTVNAQGIKIRHQGRLHGSWSSERYRFYVERICTKLAERYGKNPAVIGWQLDNEPSYGGVHYDYSPMATDRFRGWLKEKYGTIAALNKAWGADFWSNNYNTFEQIRIPNQNELSASVNPHALLDFQRFNNSELTRYLALQTTTLRKYIQPRQFVTTNFAYYRFLPEINLFDKKSFLDFSSYTYYPMNYYFDAPEFKGESYRLGSGLGLSFSAEFAQSTHGYGGFMELQPGQINWGPFNAQPLPGAVRMWLFHSFGLGSNFICTYRFDRPIYGAEQYHYGIMSTDPNIVDRGGEEFVQVAKEMQALDKQRDAKTAAAEPAAYSGRRVAILYSQDNILDQTNHKQTQQWDAYEHLLRYYSAAKQGGSAVTFITEDQPLDVKRFPVLVAPAYTILDQPLVDKWTKYVQEGGHLIISCRSGHKDRNGHLYETRMAKILQPLTGAQVDYFDNMPPTAQGNVGFNGKRFAWNNWGDVLMPELAPGTQVWGSYEDQFFKGRPAVTHRKLGKGTVTYVGVDTDNGDLEAAVMQKVYAEAKIKALDLPRYFYVHWRDGYWVAVNYNGEAVQAPVPANAKIIMGKSLVAPGEVCIWKE